MTRARFPWGLTVASAILFAVLVSLGVWQVQRLQWKQGLIAGAEARRDQPPVALPPWPAAPASGASTSRWPAPPPDLEEFERVVVRCTWSAGQLAVRLRSIHDGRSGERIIQACGGYLVDLGFVPDDALAARPPLPRIDPRSFWTVEITAQARRTPPSSLFAPPPEGTVFYGRDNRAMARALHVPLYDRPTLFAETVEGAIWYPVRPVPSPPPAAFSNNHLGYAITWFGLALALAGFYIALLRRKLKS